jgi:hypothetical protein
MSSRFDHDAYAELMAHRGILLREQSALRIPLFDTCTTLLAPRLVAPNERTRRRVHGLDTTLDSNGIDISFPPDTKAWNFIVTLFTQSIKSRALSAFNGVQVRYDTLNSALQSRVDVTL